MYEGVWVDDIPKCGTMMDFGREGAPEPTKYPLPEVCIVIVQFSDLNLGFCTNVQVSRGEFKNTTKQIHYTFAKSSENVCCYSEFLGRNPICCNFPQSYVTTLSLYFRP